MLRAVFSNKFIKWPAIILSVVALIIIGYIVITKNFLSGDETIINVAEPAGVAQFLANELELTFTDDEILSIELVQEAPYWPVNNSLFYVNYTGGYAAGINIYYEQSDLVTAEEIAQERAGIVAVIHQSLTSQGFTKQVDEGYGQTADVYIDDFTVCVMNTRSETLSPPLTIRCGSLDLYATDLDNYQASKEFADAYTAAGGIIKKGDVLNTDSIKNSETKGYQKSSVVIGSLNTVASQELSFYKKDGEAWQYFADTQAALSCDKYNTVDLRAAFLGDACIDSATRQATTVRQEE